MSKNKKRFKVIIVGDEGVGRTSTLLRYENVFQFIEPMTIGFKIYKFQYKFLEENITAEVFFFDLVGDTIELFKPEDPTIQKFYIRANGILMIFDLTRAETLKSLLKWYMISRKIVGNDMEGIVIGNKLDLERKIHEQEGRAFAEKLGYQYREISAKMNQNVIETIHTLLSNIFKTKKFERMYH